MYLSNKNCYYHAILSILFIYFNAYDEVFLQYLKCHNLLLIINVNFSFRAKKIIINSDK